MITVPLECKTRVYDEAIQVGENQKCAETLWIIRWHLVVFDVLSEMLRAQT